MTSATYAPIDEHAEDYKQAGRLFMERAEWDFARGDLVRASEGAWEAAAQFVKAAAAQRGWGHEDHILIAQSAGELRAETGNDDIVRLFSAAASLRANFQGGGYISEDDVRLGMDCVHELISILEEIPPPKDRPRYWIRHANGDWIMTYIPLDEHAEEYKQTGRWFMDQAEWEFERGDLLQASEKAWGAAAQFLKALATQRGWGHESHQHLGQVANKLALETGNNEIITLFDVASGLHSNFYAAFKDENAVRWGLDEMHRFLDILESIPQPEPPRIGYAKQRTFHRTRADA